MMCPGIVTESQLYLNIKFRRRHPAKWRPSLFSSTRVVNNLCRDRVSWLQDGPLHRWILFSDLKFSLRCYSLSAHPRTPSFISDLVTYTLNGFPGALQTFRWRTVTYRNDLRYFRRVVVWRMNSTPSPIKLKTGVRCFWNKFYPHP